MAFSAISAILLLSTHYSLFMNDQVHLNSKSSNNMDIVTRFQKHASDFQKKTALNTSITTVIV